jgi:hypothetical protein
MMYDGGAGYRDWLLLLAVVGMLVGFAWLHRIAGGNEDPDRSFSRLSGQRGGGSRLPDAPGIPERPTWGWLLTRGAIAIGLGATLLAIGGPMVMRRWEPALELGATAVFVWMSAVATAVIGTAWMVRIARHGPEDGARPWRHRR